MSDKQEGESANGSVQYSFFKCGTCGHDRVAVMNIGGVIGAACGKFKTDGTGCQTPFPEMLITFTKPEANNKQ